jgi:glycosyltransferase involved in cell wall biosynthesis
MFPASNLGRLKSYQVITANSAYTRDWIATRWRRPAEVVYSAVEPMGPPGSKKNIILNVARFQADVGDIHFKHQDTLLRAFHALRARTGSPWEMHFAGTIGSHSADRAYAESLREGAGADVHFHFDIPQAGLRELYRSATLYWHATGCGDPTGASPERQEHFGITIVEAMSAGAIPLSYDGGGPRETIGRAESGYLWAQPEELVAHSLALIGDPSRRAAMSAHCVERSRLFDKGEYLRRMDAIVDRLLAQ